MSAKVRKIKGPNKAELIRKVVELTAQLASTYHFADATLSKAGDLMGSGVLLQLSALGGRELISPVVIRDGLSPETIAAIRKDIMRSYETATAFKFKRAKESAS
ncbi:hypothetical protein G3A39_43175 [Paraburkholderia aspalathi]|nr:hypothetical protein [Paraburkholderia aspalathi]